MPRKWEQAIPTIEAYLLSHDNKPYLSDMVDELHLSAYVIETALSKLSCSDAIQHGLSPEKKVIRDKKISENISKQYADGTFPKISYDDEWKAKCKEGRAAFDSDPKAQKNAREQRNRTNVAKYGEGYASQFHEKAKQTKLERYGSAGYNNYKKACETRLEKYGNINYNNREQASQTCMERYGGVGNASPELLAKYEATCIKKYGVKTNLISKDPYLNGYNSVIARFGSIKEKYNFTLSKGQQTRQQKYGDPFWSNREKAIATMQERYGVPYYTMTDHCKKERQRPDVIEHRLQTMRERGSFNTSKPEEDYFSMLCQQHGECNVKRQYSDKSRYPFSADFYVATEDLFIECNFHWTHNTHPFNALDLRDLETLQLWISKSETSDFYKIACYVWADLDVRKIETARNNKLNFKFVYCTEEGNQYDYVI